MIRLFRWGLGLASLVCLSQATFAGDELDSILRCENVSGYTVYARSENHTRDGKVDIVGSNNVIKYSFPTRGRTILANSWIDLNEYKALYMVTNSAGRVLAVRGENRELEGKVALWLKLKQTKPKAKASEAGASESHSEVTPTASEEDLAYTGDIETDKSFPIKIHAKKVVCQCGHAASQVNGIPNYATWKQVPCTPNSKGL